MAKRKRSIPLTPTPTTTRLGTPPVSSQLTRLWCQPTKVFPRSTPWTSTRTRMLLDDDPNDAPYSLSQMSDSRYAD